MKEITRKVLKPIENELSLIFDEFNIFKHYGSHKKIEAIVFTFRPEEIPLRLPTRW